jgi:sulfoxide reductase heme-binding subunit YedZ
MNRLLASKWTKRVLFALCLVPLAWLGWRGYQGDLTANPIEFITHYTGDWTIRFLLITLAVTPLRTLLNLPQLTRFRRMFGLFAFFYGVCHFSIWFVLDKFFSLPEMWADVIKRRYITVGMLGLLIMIPLAVTSTNGWVKRLGWLRWQKLHRIVYVAPAAGVVHYWWLVKSDIRLPAMYGAILTVLMLYRVFLWTRKKAPVVRRAPPVASVS